jgi:sugar/nucleoside kinase (ribokinase family)
VPPFDVLANVDILTPNQTEAVLLGEPEDAEIVAGRRSR